MGLTGGWIWGLWDMIDLFLLFYVFGVGCFVVLLGRVGLGRLLVRSL